MKDFKYISVICPIMNLLKWAIVLFFAWVEENKTLLARKRLIKLLTNCSKTKEKGWKATKTKTKTKKTQRKKKKKNSKLEIEEQQKTRNSFETKNVLHEIRKSVLKLF